MKTIKSYIYELHGPKKLELIKEDVKIESDNDVLAETYYSAISPGTELSAWLGKPPLRPSKVYPRLQGYCNIARVLEVGKSVESIHPGDWILTHQSHRSHFRVAAKDILICIKDLDRTDAKKIVTTYLFHLGYSALLKGGYFPGHKVSIVGLGSLGYAATSLVSLFGGSPVVFTSQKNRESLFNNMHVSTVQKNDACTQNDLFQTFDLSIITSDSWEDYLLALNLLRTGGVGVLLGFPGRGLPLPKFNPLDSSLLYDKQLSLKYTGYVTEADVSEIDVRFTLKRNIKFLSDLILDERLDTLPFTELCCDWKELGNMYELINNRQTDALTGILEWN